MTFADPFLIENLDKTPDDARIQTTAKDIKSWLKNSVGRAGLTEKQAEALMELFEATNRKTSSSSTDPDMVRVRQDWLDAVDSARRECQKEGLE